MITPFSHILPIATVSGGTLAAILAWMATDPLTGLAVASGALFVSWLSAMFAAQYQGVANPISNGSRRP